MPRITKAECFDRLADQGLWKEFSPEEKPKLRMLLKRLNLRPGMVVFEPGCGTGRLTVELLKAVSPGGGVIAADISPRMLSLARRRGLQGNVRWVVGPAEKIHLPKSSVDRIVCFQSFPHFGEKQKLLSSFRRFLKPEGLLAIVHFASRRKINRIHSQGPPPIRKDLIPPACEMREMLRKSGFILHELTSTKDIYCLIAGAERLPVRQRKSQKH